MDVDLLEKDDIKMRFERETTDHSFARVMSNETISFFAAAYTRDEV